MAHHANDGSASRVLRGLLREHGYNSNPGPLLATAAAQDARCAQGQHDETTAREGYVTHIGLGRRVEPGTRYCRYCKAILGEKRDAPSARPPAGP
jgi:hypothetical protein